MFSCAESSGVVARLKIRKCRERVLYLKSYCYQLTEPPAYTQSPRGRANCARNVYRTQPPPKGEIRSCTNKGKRNRNAGSCAYRWYALFMKSNLEIVSERNEVENNVDCRSGNAVAAAAAIAASATASALLTNGNRVQQLRPAHEIYTWLTDKRHVINSQRSVS